MSDLIEKEEIRKGVTHDAAPRPGRISQIYFKIFQGFSMYVHTHIIYIYMMQPPRSPLWVGRGVGGLVVSSS